MNFFDFHKQDQPKSQSVNYNFQIKLIKAQCLRRTLCNNYLKPFNNCYFKKNIKTSINYVGS